MSDKHFVGLDLTGFEDNGRQKPISRVTMMIDDENAITAGDDTGLELVASNPHATQEMVNAILAQVKGYQYHMMEAEDANLDPAAELGDGVTAGPVYTVLSRIAEDGDGYAGMRAPGEAELQEEYPEAGPMTQSFNRKLSEVRSSITKTAEEIRLEVTNEVNGLQSQITQTASSLESQITNTEKGLQSQITQNYQSLSAEISSTDGKVSSLRLDLNSIETRVENTEGDVSSLSQTVSGISARVSSAETGLSQTVRIAADGVTVTNASGSKLTIDGGQIDAENLNLSGRITFSDLNSATQTKIDNAETDAGAALDTANSANETIEGWSYRGGTYIDGSMIKAGTVMASKLIGGEVQLLTESEDAAGGIVITDASTADFAIDYYSNGAMRIQAYGRSATLYLEAGNNMDNTAVALTKIKDWGWVTSFSNHIIPSGEHNASVGLSDYPWDDMTAYAYDTVSDRKKKTDISYDLSAYDTLFDRLKPAGYRLVNGTSGRIHLGLIAQDLEEAMSESGIGSMDFAGLVIGNLEAKQDYSLRYNEIFTLCIRQIQMLKEKAAKLEEKINELEGRTIA